MTRGYEVTELRWTDVVLDEIVLPRRTLRITLGLGSGLARAAGDDAARLWAITDRGPNLKVRLAVETYGLDHLAHLLDVDGAKIMPRPELGPTIAELRIEEDTVRLVAMTRLRRPDASLLSGLPPPGGGEAEMEPTFDLDGRLLPAEGGADTEGLAVAADGSFWVAEEYGPSLMKVDPGGHVTARWTPHPLAARRRPNRGFEALTLSADGAWLYAAFQSPLDHPDAETGAQSRLLRIWKIATATGAVAAQYAYLLDKPGTFERDAAAGDVERRDLKVCELTWIGDDRLLVLERISQTAKIYRIDLTGRELPPAHLDPETRPTLEELDPKDIDKHLPKKVLIISTDWAPEIAPDLEGMAAIGERELILVTDNDFGTEGAATRFYRVRFDQPF